MKLVLCVPHHLSLWRVPDWFAPRLRKEFPTLRIEQLKSYDELGDAITDADILMAWSIRPEQFNEARKLRWIHCPAAAVHNLLIPEVVKSDVLVTNSSEVHGLTVAEHVMALLLACAKRLPRLRDFQHEHVWGLENLLNEWPRPRGLKGSTVLVIGMGAIGGNVARMAKALGMRVLGVREHANSADPNVERMYSFEQLRDALPEADFVVVAAPVTPKTVHMLNAERLAATKRGAYVINVARGALIDTDALVAAIHSRHVGGAALDVFEEEPLPADSALWDMKEVFITPHSAGLNENLWERHYEMLSENLLRFERGETLIGLVDKQKGY